MGLDGHTGDATRCGVDYLAQGLTAGCGVSAGSGCPRGGSPYVTNAEGESPTQSQGGPRTVAKADSQILGWKAAGSRFSNRPFGTITLSAESVAGGSSDTLWPGSLISVGRAVGLALGANPVPLVVPCHRVVAHDGSLGGFSGGLQTKRRLLKLEGTLRHLKGKGQRQVASGKR